VSWSQQGTWEATEAFETATPTQRWPGTLTPLGGPALIRSAVDWLTEPHELLSGHSKGENVSPEAVEVLAHRVVQLRRLDDAQGGPLVLDWVVQDLRWVAYLVRRGSYDAVIGAQLHSILAELAQLAGWLAGDLAQHAVGQRYLLLGLHAAHTAGDRALGATTGRPAPDQAGAKGCRPASTRGRPRSPGHPAGPRARPARRTGRLRASPRRSGRAR
jgi:hypothetical protein